MRFRTSTLVVLASVVLSGCRPDGAVTPTAVALKAEQVGSSPGAPGRLVACATREVALDSALIGPSGGTLRVGRNELVVPPGALIDPVMLRGDVLDAAVASIRLLPEGLVFRKPAGLALDVDGCADPGAAPKILYLDDDGNVLEEIDAEYSPAWKRVAAPINHLSRYALGV